MPTLRLRGEKNRRAFTLIDLLVAMTIISVLAAMVFGALGAARGRARIDQTQRLVAKLNTIILAKYDSYRTRRVPMDLRQYVWTYSPLNSSAPAQYYDPAAAGWPHEIARARVNAIRDLMRLEMPDRWSDVIWAGTPAERANPALVPLVLPSPPSLTCRYNRIYNSSPADDNTKDEWGAAECLYMIVMAIPDAAEQFHESEIGDIDGDGLPEFHDGWGRPIRFIRWPAGFYWDPVNDFYGVSDLQFGPEDRPKYQPDPFDPQRVLVTQGSFAVYPLIYSAGPDGEFDVNIGKCDGGTATQAYGLDANGNIDPFAKDEEGHYVGLPYNDDAGDDPGSEFRDLQHNDNIYNQKSETR